MSAIKVNGQRAYKLTRAGAAPELAARPVTVYEFTVTDIRQDGDFLDIDARVRCSSGTYIRALARDLGAALGTGGHLTALRRTAVGPYDLDPGAHSRRSRRSRPERSGTVAADSARHRRLPVAACAGPCRAAPRPPRALIPLADAAAAAFPRLDLTADEARRLAQGARLPLARGGRPPTPPLAAFDPEGTLIGLVTGEERACSARSPSSSTRRPGPEPLVLQPRFPTRPEPGPVVAATGCPWPGLGPPSRRGPR